MEIKINKNLKQEKKWFRVEVVGHLAITVPLVHFHGSQKLFLNRK